MPMTELVVRKIEAQEMPDLNSYVVVLAERDDGSGARIELQRALEFDEQDIRLGMDTYSIGTESGATCYGGIESHALGGGELIIELDRKASETLGIGPKILCKLMVNADEVAALHAGLDRVLGRN